MRARNFARASAFRFDDAFWRCESLPTDVVLYFIKCRSSYRNYELRKSPT